ncbi:MAG: acetyl-CoA carboxylase biotin carboxyl carrier protein [Candidatus Zipacnadales bacterium]
MPGFCREDIEWLIKLAEREDLEVIEVSQGEASVTVKRRAKHSASSFSLSLPAPTAKPDEAPQEDLVPVLAPMAGSFYRSPAPGALPFADVGDEVQQGETVCLIEAMKLYNDVVAPCAGRIEKFFVHDGDHVDADQELLLIRRIS